MLRVRKDDEEKKFGEERRNELLLCRPMFPVPC
jgi:hypothetical protein